MNPILMLWTVILTAFLAFTYRVKLAHFVKAYTTVRRGAISIGKILVVFITVLIGAVLAGPFQTQITNNLVNYTGGALAIGNQIPLFYVLLLVVVIVAPVATEFARLD